MSSTLPNGEVAPTDSEGGEFDGAGVRSRPQPPGADEPLEGDERMYTGEPVDDGEHVRRPQQMNAAGRANIEGGGEWPDPKTPPSPGAAADEPADR